MVLIVAILCLPNIAKAQYRASNNIGPRTTWEREAKAQHRRNHKFYDGPKEYKTANKKHFVKVPRARNIYLAKITTDSVTNITTARWEDGAIYIGEIYYAELKGRGTMNYPDGGKYIGDWSRDRRWGVGTMYYPNGDVYHGGWMWDMPEGEGTLITAEGVKITATFDEGIPRGKCIIQDVDGRLYSARWVRGKLKEKSIKPIEKE